MRNLLSSFLEVVELALVAVGAVILIRTFLIQPFLVNGASMIPSFSNGDYLLIDELTYRFRTPERGEVVVFRNPNDERTFFIKRVIGLPGETVAVRGNKVAITNDEHPNGLTLEEPYLSLGTLTSGNAVLELREEEYFVLGDNRSYSYDSRNWGTLQKDNIVGLVRVRLWPLADAEAFAAPRYAD